MASFDTVKLAIGVLETILLNRVKSEKYAELFLQLRDMITDRFDDRDNHKRLVDQQKAKR